MTAKVRNKIIKELKSHPDEKCNSLPDYINFLKYEDQVKIPNEETLQTFKDTDAGKNLVLCKDIDDMFEKLGI